MEFYCNECKATVTRTPNRQETPFEVEGVEGVFLSGFKGQVVEGKFVVEAAAFPRCGGMAPRTQPQPGRHRLVLRSSGDPRFASIELDGEQLTFVSRVALDLDCNGSGAVKLTIPTTLVDLDVDVAAFVTAHADSTAQVNSDSCAHCGHARAAHDSKGERGCRACPAAGFVYAHLFDVRA